MKTNVFTRKFAKYFINHRKLQKENMLQGNDVELEHDSFQGENMFNLNVISLLENYGWYILLCSIICVYIYFKKVKPHLDAYLQKRSEDEYARKYHKNPDLLTERLQMQHSRYEQMQEKYKRDAEEYARKMEEKEAKKRQEMLAKMKNEGNKLGSGKASAFRTDNNLPLSNTGSSSNYRPPKRSCCGGGR